MKAYLGDVYLGGGSDDVDLVDSAKRVAVQLVGSGSEEQSAAELLQEHNTLALVNTGEYDTNGSLGEGRSQGALVVLE